MKSPRGKNKWFALFAITDGEIRWSSLTDGWSQDTDYEVLKNWDGKTSASGYGVYVFVEVDREEG